MEVSSSVSVNEAVLERFRTLIQRNRLAHAYLFVGPKGVGKTETALAVAKSINCEEESGPGVFFCGQCPSCRKIASGNHPDVHVVEAEYGTPIKIEQIRTILDQGRLRPFEASKNIFILKNVEYLRLEAGNALLKTLEEPSASSLLLLTTAVLEKNLDTIRSRCHAVYFPALPNIKLARHLEKQYALDERHSGVLSYFAQGCLGRAQELKDKDFLNVKNRAIDQFIYSSAPENFLKSILPDKEKTKIFLEILLSWTRDALLLKREIEEAGLIHRDRVRELQIFQGKFSCAELEDLAGEIVFASKSLEENLNVKIPLSLVHGMMER